MILNSPYISGSLTVTGTTVLSGSVTLASGASIAGTSSLATTALTASSVSNLNQNVQITGSLGVTSTITAQTLNVQTVTSSIVYSSGSNIFGNTLSNVQQMTGSVNVTGSLTVTTTGTEFQVATTGVKIGNVSSDYHTMTGSLAVNPFGLFVSSSGIVGVGTLTPNSTFQVSRGGATFQVTDTNKNTSNSFSIYGYTQTSWAIATGNSGSFSGGEKIIITDSGNVSIGTTNISTRFNIQASSNFETATLGTATGTMGYLSANGLYGMYIGIGNSGNTWLQSQRNDSNTTAYNILLNPQGGNVGIGTTSPAQVLDVRSTVGGNACYVSTTTGTSSLLVGLDASGLPRMFTAGNPLTFWTNSTERWRISTGGAWSTNGNTTETSDGLDKFSMGYSNASYGWLQTWGGTPLYLNRLGNAVYAGTQRIDNNSDERIKENISPISNALNTVLALNGRKFNMLDEEDVLRYGFVAQEVQPHLSDFVKESDRSFEKGDIKIKNLLTLESSGAAWSALLVEAIKEQQTLIESLKARIEVLESK